MFRRAIFGLTATPLLDSTNRVIELANLVGNAYVIGLSHHWRNLEKESGRDIFLGNLLEPKQSREIRKHVYGKTVLSMSPFLHAHFLAHVFFSNS